MLVTVTVPRIMWLRHALDYQVAAGSWRLDEYINIEWSEIKKKKKATNWINLEIECKMKQTKKFCKMSYRTNYVSENFIKLKGHVFRMMHAET